MQTARDTLPPWLAFERRIFVKQNAADVLRKALRHGSDKHMALLRGETIVIGTATDPFQPAERRFRVTRSVLEVLADHPGLSICIITKSPLITRDIDVLAPHRSHLDAVDSSLAHLARPRAGAHARAARANAGSATARVGSAARERHRDGHQRDAGAPGDHRRSRGDLERLVMAVGERGASYVNACALRLRSTARARYLPFIEQEFPHLAKRYRATYASDYQRERDVQRAASARRCDRSARSTAWSTARYGRAPDDASKVIADRFAGSEQLAFDV